jgi:hypothetical protein
MTPNHLTMQRVVRTWWPLAASWLLMAFELPGISAIIARLPNPEVNLAAYGGIVFPLSLIVESPIIMLLAASTALSKDWPSYVKMRRFMMRLSLVLTGIHLLVALTPLYYVIVEGIIGAPEEIVAPARIGLIIATPWTWSIAYRRFHQGVLIRHDRSRVVSTGTIIRLGSNWLVLAVGYLLGTLPGIVVGTLALVTGVVSEAVFIGVRVRPVLRDELRNAPLVDPPLTFREFLTFYIPLLLTSALNMLVQPMGSMALSRMPLALESLAVWPVLSGLSFLFISPGIAYNEVVVATMDTPGAVPKLRRFTLYLAAATTLLLLLVTATPLARIWVADLSALSADLATIALPGLWLMLPSPALIAMQSWYQGTILNSRRTRAITEAIVIFLATCGAVLGIGVIRGKGTGLYVGLAAYTLARIAQTVWLWLRSRQPMRAREARETAAGDLPMQAAETPAR